MSTTLPRWLVRRELAAWRHALGAALAARAPELDATSVLEAVAGRAQALGATMPDPGLVAPQLRAFSVVGVIYVAVYLALRERGGYDAALAWEVCEAATRARLARMTGLERVAASWGLYSWPMKALSRWLSRRTRRAPVGGWSFDVVDDGGGPGGVDLGVDYTRCAIRELAAAHGASEFAPYVCLADVTASEALGWGLTRTETLAQGGARCDFRFRLGGRTDVKVHLPLAG